MSDTAETISTSSVTENGPTSRTLTIEIPASVVSERIRDAFDTLRTEAALPGFRKGHAPRALLEKRFGESVRDEAKGQLISAAYSEAVEEHGLKVIGNPVADHLDTLKLVEGEPVKVSIEVEVMPEFDLPELAGLELKRPMLEVTDEMVDRELERICLSEGDLEDRETGEPGDYISGRGVMRAGETVIHDINGAVVQLPKGSDEGMILGVLVTDLAKQLGSPKAGDELTVKAKGPENHENEAARNADLEITFSVDAVSRIIPASADAIAERSGMEGEQAVRDALRQQLQQRVDADQATILRRQVAAHLLKTISFDLPQRVSAQQAQSVFERRRIELMHRGVDPQKIEENIARLRSASAADALRELKLLFILSKVAEQKSVSVSEAEINGAIVGMARRRGVRPEALRQQVIQNRQVNTIYQQIMEHKALDAIVAEAKIEDVTTEQWNEYAKSLGDADAAAAS
ncbi:MAG: trigger factor [Phycisphaerales bacterium]